MNVTSDPENTSLAALDPALLVPMDMFAGVEPLRVDLSYATPQSFCGVIYRPAARLWLHADLAALVVRAARLCHARTGLSFILYDGLRTVEAQAAMQDSAVVQAHPQWLAGPDRVLSPPGMGGHPRAMAVDIGLEGPGGGLIDMGTAFDEMPLNGPGPATNKAHRDYAALPPAVKANRDILTQAMVTAAQDLDLSLLPLPVEWWDFRFPASLFGRYAPLADADLPAQMRMTDSVAAPALLPDFPPAHFEALAACVRERAGRVCAANACPA